MSCNEVKDLIQLYLDREMDARGTLEAQRHLDSCAACSRLIASLLEQDRLLKLAARAEAVNSGRVRASVLDAIRNQPIKSRFGWAALPFWGRVAAAAVLAIGLVWALERAGLLPGMNPNVYASVAADHADHCSFDNFMGAVTDSNELNRLSGKYGNMDVVPDLSAFGYGNARGRVCKLNGSEFLHLVYYDQNRQAISVFVRPRSATLPVDQLVIRDELRYTTVSLSRSGIDVIVVSSASETHTSAMAEAIAPRP
ncbi:MAG TPA: zf-HC2 domain-containing protein [Blastocatellia bacterium]|nr:zf-HC2 domain-containing protein [Blastocatellia bacterium]